MEVKKMSKQLWETRPLEIWGRAKALRARWQKSIDESAEQENLLLAHGNTGEVDWRESFKGLNIIEDNPVGAMMASVSDSFARKARLASEIRGWGREICGYVQNCWGVQFLGYQLDNSPFPLRDMCVPFSDPCDQHTKRGQQCMDFSPIPRWGGDWMMYLGERDPQREVEMIEERVYNTLKVIDDIERIFGIEFDDEKFVESIKAHRQVGEYALKVTQSMTNIPSPLGQKDLYSFYTLGGLTKVAPDELVDFWKSFSDELQWRIDNHIAAVGNERYRWMEAHPSPWHYLRYYRYMEQYGAVCVGSQYSHMMAGPIELKPDGTMDRREMIPRPAGTEIRTREDAVRAALTEARGHRFKDDEYFRLNAITDFAKGFKVNGALMPLYRGGVGCTLTRKEQGLQLSEIGVRVMHYEGSQPGDRTDLDERRFMDQLDTWMEGQGLRKFEE
jgi:benzoyl-CoA reductase subunit B